ncbi:MAG: hypothetical protein K2G52_13560 [Muribaculaceae bacterium]|nr:hypothetical protein [Muribaculaceae bacterium]
MKKLIVLSVVTFVLGGAVVYANRNFETCCGIEVQTVDQDYFDNPEDNKDFEEDLNAIYCNDDCSGPRESN